MRFRDLESVRRLGREAARRALEEGRLDACLARTDRSPRRLPG
jgi:hypothetical protein